MEFEDVRVYIPGDDVRQIDWNVTARLGVPHIKQYREEREMQLMLVADVSASMNFGAKCIFLEPNAILETLSYEVESR